MAVERIGPQPDDNEANSQLNPDNFFEPYINRAYAVDYIGKVLSGEEIKDQDLFRILATTASIFYYESKDNLGQNIVDPQRIAEDFNSPELKVGSVDPWPNGDFKVDDNDSDTIEVTLSQRTQDMTFGFQDFDRQLGFKQQPKSETQDRKEVSYVTLTNKTTGSIRETRVLELERDKKGNVTKNEFVYIHIDTDEKIGGKAYQIKSSKHISDLEKRGIIDTIKDYLQHVPSTNNLN